MITPLMQDVSDILHEHSFGRRLVRNIVKNILCIDMIGVQFLKIILILQDAISKISLMLFIIQGSM